jgi:hypothetical protein
LPPSSTKLVLTVRFVQSPLQRAVDGALSLSTGWNAVAKLDEYFRSHADNEKAVDDRGKDVTLTSLDPSTAQEGISLA